jgi:MFS family permease
MPPIFLVGKLLDVLGRRRGAVVIFTLTAIGIFLAYTLQSRLGLTVGLVLGMFGVSAVLPVMNAYTTERFRRSCAAMPSPGRTTCSAHRLRGLAHPARDAGRERRLGAGARLDRRLCRSSPWR